MKKVCALILAGGHSSRMGKDKGLLMKNGQYWVNFIKDKIPENVDCYVSVGLHNIDKYADAKIEDLVLDNDAFEDVCGPIKGVLSGRHCFNLYDKLLVTTCDMIDLSKDTFVQLLSQRKSCCFEVGGEVQPLPFLLKKNTLDELSKLDLLENVSLKNILTKLDVGVVKLTSSNEFMNYNWESDIPEE